MQTVLAALESAGKPLPSARQTAYLSRFARKEMPPMTREHRQIRIRQLTHELATLLEEEAPRPPVKFLTASDVPAWVLAGLSEAIRRKLANHTSH
jgi:hypothetical protein